MFAGRPPGEPRRTVPAGDERWRLLRNTSLDGAMPLPRVYADDELEPRFPHYFASVYDLRPPEPPAAVLFASQQAHAVLPHARAFIGNRPRCPINEALGLPEEDCPL